MGFARKNHQSLKSSDVINDVFNLLNELGQTKKGDIESHLKESHGVRIIRRVLERHTDELLLGMFTRKLKPENVSLELRT